jgi:hypothetical protein
LPAVADHARVPGLLDGLLNGRVIKHDPSEPATQGHSFDCLVGAGTVIKVTITDDQGNYTFVPVGANSGTGPPSWATSATAPPISASAPPTGTSAPGSRRPFAGG